MVMDAVPAAGGQALEETGLGRGLIEMERLRIELLGEGFDLIGINAVGLADKALTHRKVFKIELVHSPL